MPHSIRDTVAIVFDFGVLVKFFIKFVDVKYVFFSEYRDVIQNHADSMGESMYAFIKRAIEETMARDKEMNGE